MNTVLNKYELLFTSEKVNVMSPEHEKTMALTTVGEKVKYNNLNIFKSIMIYPKKKKLKRNHSHIGKSNGEVNKKDDKGIQMRTQYKWKLEAPKYRDAQTKNMNRGNYHCLNHKNDKIL